MSTRRSTRSSSETKSDFATLFVWAFRDHTGSCLKGSDLDVLWAIEERSEGTAPQASPSKQEQSPKSRAYALTQSSKKGGLADRIEFSHTCLGC
jgi:hypothetical protein